MTTFILSVMLIFPGLALLSGPWPVAGQEDATRLAVDAGIEGNSDSAVGEVEDCASVEAGVRFQVDIVVVDVTDLLAWELSLDYDSAVLSVVDHDVKLFLGANDGSAPVDISGRLPNDSGSHTLSAFDSSDPLTPDSGSGVLARVTLEARAEGETELKLGERDVNDDGVLDRGTLLKDIEARPIGDTTGDGFFDGEASTAIVVVGEPCPDGYTAATIDTSGDRQSDWQIYAIVTAAVTAIIGGAVGIAFLRRRRKAGPAD